MTCMSSTSTMLTFQIRKYLCVFVCGGHMHINFNFKSRIMPLTVFQLCLYSFQSSLCYGKFIQKKKKKVFFKKLKNQMKDERETNKKKQKLKLNQKNRMKYKVIISAYKRLKTQQCFILTWLITCARVCLCVSLCVCIWCDVSAYRRKTIKILHAKIWILIRCESMLLLLLLPMFRLLRISLLLLILFSLINIMLLHIHT